MIHPHTRLRSNRGSCLMYKKTLQNEATSIFTYSWPLLHAFCLTYPLPSPIVFMPYSPLISFLPMAVQYGLPGSQVADSIPFAAAIVLSVASFIAAVIRLGGYFLPRSHQPLQLVVSIISLVASTLLLGFVSSRNGMSNSPRFLAAKLR